MKKLHSQSHNKDGPVKLVVEELPDDELVVKLSIHCISHYDAMLLHETIRRELAAGNELTIVYRCVDGKR